MKALSLGAGLALLAGNLQATNRYFEDLEATSPNGRFRVEAKSPDNVGGPWTTPFQEEFRYRLLEKGKTGEGEVWSRQQPMKPDNRSPQEGPPEALYVSDDGWVVIRTADLWTRCELVVVNPAGHDKLRVDILNTLLPDRTAFLQYVTDGSAGLHWGEEYCRPYFVALAGKAHFCLATWWGQRLLLDLSAGHTVADAAEFEPELLKVEKAFALATLEATDLWKFNLEEKINPGLAEGSPGPRVQDAAAAVLLTARLKIMEAVPSVRKLESSPVVMTTVSRPSAYDAPVGLIKPATYQNLAVRQAAQLCLRRLGLQPSHRQSTRLFRNGNYWQPEDPLPFQREQRVPDLKPGMKPEDVIALIGAPDFITTQGWEYDLDGGEPATLVVRWGQAGCEKIETRMPPKWRDGVERDDALIH